VAKRIAPWSWNLGRSIRSGVGQISPTKIVFAISENPVIFLELADLFRVDYGCQEELYLDGAISRAWIPSLDHRDLGGDFGVMNGSTAATRLC
jgi:uncharacterized protein YigE (DUF2233 family)